MKVLRRDVGAKYRVHSRFGRLYRIKQGRALARRLEACGRDLASVPAGGPRRVDFGAPLAFPRNHGIAVPAAGHRHAGWCDDSAAPTVRPRGDGPASDFIAAAQRHVQKRGASPKRRRDAQESEVWSLADLGGSLSRFTTPITLRARVELRVL